MDCDWYHDRDPTLKSGVYELSFEGLEFPAYCDIETADPGWTVIQRRLNKKKYQTDFYRYWKDYRDGFGDPADDHWLGSPMPTMTWSRLDCALPATSIIYDAYLLIPQVSLEDSGTYVCTTESRIGIDKQRVTMFVRVSDTTRKNLGCGNLYTENRGLVRSNGMKFSTRDRNNQNYNKVNYAVWNRGAWWYADRPCIYAGPNDKDFLPGYRLSETAMKLKCDLPKKTK